MLLNPRELNLDEVGVLYRLASALRSATIRDTGRPVRNLEDVREWMLDMAKEADPERVALPLNTFVWPL